ncbi:MAG: hypothetical protein PVJ02_11405 [Gemmatimonadota bacterium]|jgi:hypothetical protein
MKIHALAPSRRRTFTIPASRRAGGIAWVLLVLLALVGGCRKGPTRTSDAGGIDRDTFISTYVDLRTATIRARPDSLDPQVRAGILKEHGVTADQLLRFVQAHGEDVGYMRDLWDDVEKRLDAVRLGEGGADVRR